MPAQRLYAVVLLSEPEAGGFSVSAPALPEIATQGGTLAMAALLISLGVVAIVFDSVRASLTFHPIYSAPSVFSRRGFPLFPLALVLIAVGLLSRNKRRRRRRR
jgi:hypothetical protein